MQQKGAAGPLAARVFLHYVHDINETIILSPVLGRTTSPDTSGYIAVSRLFGQTARVRAGTRHSRLKHCGRSFRPTAGLTMTICLSRISEQVCL